MNTPDDFLLEKANQYFLAKDYARAEALATQALSKNKANASALCTLGSVCLRTQRLPQAIALLESSSQLQASKPCLRELIAAYAAQGKISEAEQASLRMLKAYPDDADSYKLHGELMLKTRRSANALSSFQRAYRIKPEAPVADVMGRILMESGNTDQAIACFNKAIAIDQDCLAGYINMSSCLLSQERMQDAVELCEKAIGRKLSSGELYSNYGVALTNRMRLEEAVVAFKKSLELRPDSELTTLHMANAVAHSCDWELASACQSKALAITNRSLAAGHGLTLTPFTSLTLDIAPGKQREIAEFYASKQLRAPAQTLPAQRISPSGAPIILGYLSSDFRDHPVTHLAKNLFKHHDRKRFKVICYSAGPDDGSSYRSHVAETCDRFVDVSQLDAAQTALKIRQDNVDILIEMNGHTPMNRLTALKLRPARVSMHYLGYPGTLGTDFIDYFITDRYLSPKGAETHFCEKLIRMPDTYQINDDEAPASDAKASRSDENLPEGSFVFASFNASYKIESGIFDCWMRILKRVSSSVLWLLARHENVETRLKQAAEARGVSPERLVFAAKTSKPQHLARHALADLFLDTHIVCGHTTARDALQAGLPVIACPGETFISRVSGSLLRANGLDELICDDLGQYEELAVTLATDAGRLRALREKLASNSAESTKSFVSNLEKAYSRAMQLHREGKPPQHIDVATLR